MWFQGRSGIGAVVVCWMMMPSIASAGFTGAYAPGSWTWVDPGVGGYGTLDADTMYVVGGDSYVSGACGYYIGIGVCEDTVLEFDWSYFSINSPGWDYAFYSVNGVMTMLSDTSGGAGAASVPVSAGDSFGLGVYTVDGAYGPGELTVTNFLAGDDVVGACCWADGSCTEVDESCCWWLGGEYKGDWTDCDEFGQLGACCLPDGSCTEVTKCKCNSLGGDYKGAGTNCASVDCDGGGGVPVNNPPIGKVTKEVWWIGGASYDTVILSTGDYYLTETDLKIPGRGFDFEFTRTYRSRSSLAPETFVEEGAGRLGSNWDFNYNMRLKYDGASGMYIYYDGAGRKDAYNTPADPGGPPPGYYDGFEEIVPGQQAQITKKDGTRFLYGLQPDGFLRLDSITDRNDNQMQFIYGATGPLGTQLDYIIDTLDRVIDFTYNADGTLALITDFAGRTLSYEYDANHDLIRATSPAVTYPGNEFPDGKSSQYEYDTTSGDPALRHNLLKVADGMGQVFLENTYTAEDQLETQRYGDPAAGETFSYQYISEAPGEPNHMLTKETDRNGNVAEWLINQNFGDATDHNKGHVVAKTEWVELVPGDGLEELRTDYEYNKWGEKIREVLPRGNLIEYEYDEDNPEPRQKGNLLVVRRLCGTACLGGDPAALETVYTYEANFNQVKTTTDPRGNTTTNFFDYEEATLGDLNDDGITDQDSGNIVRIEYPTVNLPDGSVQNPIRKIQYNDWGQVTREIEPKGNATAYEYYTSGAPTGYLWRVTRDPDGLACENTYEYDPVGNVILQTDGFVRDTIFEVNELNQIQKTLTREVTLFGGAQLRYETLHHYDANNNIVWTEVSDVTDEGIELDPIRTEFEYDWLNNVTVKREQKASGVFIATTYQYDANENRISVTLPEGNIIKYEYDARDLRIAETRGFGSPEAATTSTRYDENANKVMFIGGEPERVTNYVYDGYDRLKDTIDADGNVTTQSYDENGNVIEVVRADSGGTTLARTVNHYDELNRLDIADVDHFDEYSVPIDDGVSRTTRFFDENSRLVRVVDDNGNETTYEYDALNRKTRSTDALGNSVAYSYDCNDNVELVTETEQGPGDPEIFTTTKLL